MNARSNEKPQMLQTEGAGRTEPMIRSADQSGEGRLVVRVYTAAGAIPLENATVVIRDSPEVGGAVVVSLITDRSGMTPQISLPAPPRSTAQQPGNVKPYSSYGIDVLLPGYYTPVFENVPIYDGITSVQNVGMIPLPENGFPDSRRPDDTIVYPESNSPGL